MPAKERVMKMHGIAAAKEGRHQKKRSKKAFELKTFQTFQTFKELTPPRTKKTNLWSWVNHLPLKGIPWRVYFPNHTHHHHHSPHLRIFARILADARAFMQSSRSHLAHKNSYQQSNSLSKAAAILGPQMSCVVNSF